MRLYQPNKVEYTARNELYQCSRNKSDIFWRYIEKEPHAFLHVGNLVKLFKASGLANKKVLSVGIDLLKDYILAKSSELDLTVLDIDESAINSAKQLMKAEGGDVSYQCIDLLSSEGVAFLAEGSFEVLLLCQMDYVFSDEQLKQVFSRAYQAGIAHIVVLSPSLYSFKTARNPLIQIKNAIDLYLGFNAALKSRRYSKDGLCTYKRLYKNFSKLLKPYYCLRSKFIYQYPSGRIHLLHYDQVKCE